MNPNKPFWQTSEFIKSLVFIILSVGLSTGYIHPGDAATMQGELMNIVTTAFSLIASMYTVGHYIKSRTEQKVATIYVNGQQPEQPPATIPFDSRK